MFKNHTKPSDYFKSLNLHILCNIIDEFIDGDNYDDWNYLSQIKYAIYEHIDFLIKSDESLYLTTLNHHRVDELRLTKEIISFILDAKVSGDKTSQLISQTIQDNVLESSLQEDVNLGSQLRKFYVMVMNSELFNIEQKFQIIYMELVVPQLAHFNCKNYDTGFDVKYSYSSPFIQEKNSKMLTVGRLHECSIITNHLNTTVSRCNFIILKIRDEYIVLSGWALCGTFCLQREDKDAEQYSGYQHLMRFHENETFVIGCGDVNQYPETITFNPKTCVVCMENKCQVRGSCNHATMCESCFAKYTSNNIFMTCPICRTVFDNNNYLSMCVETFNPRN